MWKLQYIATSAVPNFPLDLPLDNCENYLDIVLNHLTTTKIDY